MKHPQLAALSVLALAASGACAQTVTLYGYLDTGIERLTNVAAAGGASLTRLPSQTGGMGPSRWGLTGSEDLGGGLKAIFTLESGFAPDKGSNNTSQGGRLFGRQAFVGLTGSFGTVALGRQHTAMLWTNIDADPMGPAVYGIATLDGAFAGPRSDNNISYRGSWGGFTGFASYSLGRDNTNASTCAGELAGDYKACKELSLLAKYNAAGQWGAALGFDEMRGGPGGSFGLTNSNLTDRRTIGNGFVKLGPVKLGAGLIKRNNEALAAATTGKTARSDLAFIEADWALTQEINLTPLFARLKYKNSADGSKATLFAMRASYALSKRTTVYAIAGRVSNKGAADLALSTGTIATLDHAGSVGPGAGGSQNGMMIGLRHSF